MLVKSHWEFPVKHCMCPATENNGSMYDKLKMFFIQLSVRLICRVMWEKDKRISNGCNGLGATIHCTDDNSAVITQKDQAVGWWTHLSSTSPNQSHVLAIMLLTTSNRFQASEAGGALWPSPRSSHDLDMLCCMYNPPRPLPHINMENTTDRQSLMLSACLIVECQLISVSLEISFWSGDTRNVYFYNRLK